MKICIYTICKNEEKVVEQFINTTKEADYIIVCDTGSTDNTINLLKKCNNIQIESIKINPFRFDLARNKSMEFIPLDADIAIALDMDDILVDNWRELINNIWEKDTTILRYLYPYSYSDNINSIPNTIVWGFKVHKPKMYYWEHPVHEILRFKNDNSLPEKETILNKPLLIHKPYQKQERNNRLPLFEIGIKERPESERMLHLYGRELMNLQSYQTAIEIFKKHLNLTKSYPELENYEQAISRSRSCLYIANCFIAIDKYKYTNEIILWLLRAVSESPNERDLWFNLAKGWYNVGEIFSAYSCLLQGKKIINMYDSPEMTTWCWGQEGEDFFNFIENLCYKEFIENNKEKRSDL
jgi:glycosyltransferase involved in cell wall biosynthesis